MEDANLDKVLENFGDRVVKLSQINLGKSVKGRRIDATGKLRKSIKYKLDKGGNELDFYFEDYGVQVDAGVLGKRKRILKNWNKSIFKRGSGYSAKKPPFAKIRKWIDDKPIRPRNLNSGRFISTKGDVKDKMAHAIRMSIFLKGKQPTLFFSEPFNKEFKNLPDDLAIGFGKDIDNLI